MGITPSVSRLAAALGFGLLATFFVLVNVPDYRVLAILLGVIGLRIHTGARLESMLLVFAFSVFVFSASNALVAASLGRGIIITVMGLVLIAWVQLDPNNTSAENLATTWRAFSRCFGPPWVRGTIHGRWFFVGLWVSLLFVTASPPRFIPNHFAIWSFVFVVTWILHRVRPRWDPAILIRVSLFTSGAHLLWRDTAGILPRLGKYGMLPFCAMTLSLVWLLHERITLARLYSDTHPHWVLDLEGDDHKAIRVRSTPDSTYRAQARAEVVGWIPNNSGLLGAGVKSSVFRIGLATGVFALYAFLFMLLF